jgi:hypothetical protein
VGSSVYAFYLVRWALVRPGQQQVHGAAPLADRLHPYDSLVLGLLATQCTRARLNVMRGGQLANAVAHANDAVGYGCFVQVEN